MTKRRKKPVQHRSVFWETPIPWTNREISERGSVSNLGTKVAIQHLKRGKTVTIRFRCNVRDGPHHRILIHPDGRVTFPDHTVFDQPETRELVDVIAGKEPRVTCLGLDDRLRKHKESMVIHRAIGVPKVFRELVYFLRNRTNMKQSTLQFPSTTTVPAEEPHDS